MRKFNGIGKGKCGICHTSKKGKVTLLPIDETNDGNICEAQPVHIDCIELRINKDKSIIYQKVD